MNKKQMVAKMVDRFLCWKLPDDFGPDAGISFDPAYKEKWGMPVGTNLFTADQARDMILHLLGDGVYIELVEAALDVPDPVAYIFPSDLERFAEDETFSQAYSIAVGKPDEKTVGLCLHTDLIDMIDRCEQLSVELMKCGGSE